MSTDIPVRDAAAGGDDDAAAPGKDAGLPDPSGTAKVVSFLLLLVAVGLALLIGNNGTKPFDPTGKANANLGFFAGFFLAAQAIERLLELIAPFIPFWKIPVTVKRPTVALVGATRQLVDKVEVSTTEQLIAQKKADRGFVMLSLGALLGVGVSAAMGLYLPEAIGVFVPRSIDMLATGLAVSGGTKALHELIKALQKAKEPGTTAG